MLKKFTRFAKTQEGATAIEYALLVAAIALIMFVGAQLLGTNLSSAFTAIGGDVTA